MESEKEKCRQGRLYDANHDAGLLAERLACKEVCHEYNRLPPSDESRRRELMAGLLGRTGREFVIEQPFFCDYGYNVEIGENFFSNFNCVILDEAKVTFGDNVFVAPNCGFYTAGHPLDVARRNRGLEYARPITVGNNVWIGANVCVLPGVTIGDNCTIGAGSVVNRDIPSGSLAAGNPCRVIRNLDANSHKPQTMRIEHIAIWAEDLELLRDFYVRYFNMTANDKYVNEKKGFSSYFLSCDGGGSRLELMHIPGKEAPAGRDNLSGLAHFALSVGSKERVDELADRLRADGFAILSGPRTTGDGYYECAVADPEGNCVEITE